jgi:hypothetical protein
MSEFWSYPQSRSFAELLIDCEEDRTWAGRRCRLAYRQVQASVSPP